MSDMQSTSSRPRDAANLGLLGRLLSLLRGLLLRLLLLLLLHDGQSEGKKYFGCRFSKARDREIFMQAWILFEHFALAEDGRQDRCR